MKSSFIVHFVSNGGNYFILGLLVSSSFVAATLSRYVVAIIDLNKKFAITFCLYSTFCTYFLLMFSSNRWTLWLCRTCYVLTNQIYDLSQEFLETNEEFSLRGLSHLLKVTKFAGTITGAIVGGYVYDASGSFLSVAAGTSLVTLLAISFVQNLEPEVRNTRNRLSLQPLRKYSSGIKLLQYRQYPQKWKRVVLMLAFTFVYKIYFSGFIFLANSPDEISTILIGFSVAYRRIVMYAYNVVVPFMQKMDINTNLLFDYCLSVSASSFCVLSLVPNRATYFFVFPPLVLTHTLIHSFFGNDIMHLRGARGLVESGILIKDLVSLFGPFFFGILSQHFPLMAFRTLMIFPIMVCGYLCEQSFYSRET
ncbi:uncharacterized protein LOC135129495 isoform X2 [Zophobas morio]